MTHTKEDRDSVTLKRIKTIRLLLLWLVALAFMGYFSWQYYGTAVNESVNLQGAIKMKNVTPATFPKIEANKAEKVVMNGNSYSTYTVDLRASKLTFYHKTPDGKPIGTFKYLYEYLDRQQKSLVFATNGGIYTETLVPLGLYIENGKQLVPLNRRQGTDNFYLTPNGVFYIKQGEAFMTTTEGFDENTHTITHATQSGPMLLIDGKIHPRFVAGSANKNIRSGVGIIDKNKVVFAISDQPVNFYEFAVLFREKFNCRNALYLDGAISKMYLPELNRNDLDNTIGFGSFIGVELK
ncbi:phosphodiester glycosidase family protein [Emticicia agri]|uniref:Phosphodiester glycosidase domain-containing protein n=1 Tax=Emticicia agri TaxID=2492393 RepID=A0A4Q5LU83_9BACT|nr:phosphodiester glycosidase family protein [Emticicia agri]RYU93057.1 hypothetical protein EWM59_24010 [Emticicia agri]